MTLKERKETGQNLNEKVTEKIENNLADCINEIIERQAGCWTKLSDRVENKLRESKQSALTLNQLASTLEKIQKGLWTCYDIGKKIEEKDKPTAININFTRECPNCGRNLETDSETDSED